ncbi:MAG: YHYH protein [Myxococcota bacterium]
MLVQMTGEVRATKNLGLWFAMLAVAIAACPTRAEPRDMTNGILTKRSADCADYVGVYMSSVEDIQRQKQLRAHVVVEAAGDACMMTSNGIPNHDFNGVTARFANPVRELPATFRIPRKPKRSGAPRKLSQKSYDAVLLNGSPVDLLSAGCYLPDAPRADENGNVLAGCRDTEDTWLIDPPAYDDHFGVDLHNAHAQPDGRYHYHSNPNALFLDRNTTGPSPVIGFAADGFPIYGTMFRDEDGVIRRARSGYALKTKPRPAPPKGPGGKPDGTYVKDYEFTGHGDLDRCNGMTVDGQYGYYVTTTYPWILGCLSGRPDPSFDKGGGRNRRPRRPRPH